MNPTPAYSRPSLTDPESITWNPSSVILCGDQLYSSFLYTYNINPSTSHSLNYLVELDLGESLDIPRGDAQPFLQRSSAIMMNKTGSSSNSLATG